jgi:hypothetical protein
MELNYNLQSTRGVQTVVPLRGYLVQAMRPWSELVRTCFLFLELQITVGYSLVNKVDWDCIRFKMDNQLSTVSKRNKPWSATDFLTDESGTHAKIHQRLLDFYGEHTVEDMEEECTPTANKIRWLGRLANLLFGWELGECTADVH